VATIGLVDFSLCRPGRWEREGSIGRGGDLGNSGRQMGDGGREEGMSMGKGLTWMGDGFLLPCWCCASQVAAFLRGDSRGPSWRGRGMQGHHGTARQGRRRGAAAGGVGEGSRRGQRGGKRPPPVDLAQGDWAGVKSFRRGS